MHRTHQRLLVAAASALLLGGLTGCGDDSAAAPQPAPAASSSTPAADPSPSVEPPPAVPAASEDTKAARTAFAEYVVEAYEYGLRTNDPQPILDVAATDPKVACVICRNYAKDRARLERAGRTIPDLDITVDRVYPGGSYPHQVRSYLVLTHSNAADELKDGATIKTYPAEKKFVFEVGVLWTGSGYVLTGFEAGV